jgi:peptidoglycan hydrolase-like protein with peptidoglycan-binding domain
MNRKPAGARRTPAAAPRPAARRGGQKPAPRMIGQRQPTPERYKEIQEALARRGYFQDAPDGVWGPASVDALKRFQEEQNIEASGKINSLSLIALGLGPKYENAQAAPAADVSRTETPRAGAPSPPEP